MWPSQRQRLRFTVSCSCWIASYLFYRISLLHNYFTQWKGLEREESPERHCHAISMRRKRQQQCRLQSGCIKKEAACSFLRWYFYAYSHHRAPDIFAEKYWSGEAFCIFGCGCRNELQWCKWRRRRVWVGSVSGVRETHSWRKKLHIYGLCTKTTHRSRSQPCLHR